MKDMVKSDWMIAAEGIAADVKALLAKLNRDEEPSCRECGTRRAKNWEEERAARELEGAVTRIYKAVDYVHDSKE